MKNAHLWIAVCLAGMLVGCGQKGPLVLPDTPKHKKSAPKPRTPAAPRPATAAPPAVGAPATDGTDDRSNPPQKP